MLAVATRNGEFVTILTQIKTRRKHMNKKVHYLTEAAMIAALYVLLTYLSSVLGLSSGAVQLRFSEALCILPLFTPAAVPGLFLGCLLSNLLTTAIVWDILFGSLATLLGALGTYALRHRSVYLAPIPPILANTLIVPAIICAMEGQWSLALYLSFGATVFLGELISCFVFGLLLHRTCKRYAGALFKGTGGISK